MLVFPKTRLTEKIQTQIEITVMSKLDFFFLIQKNNKYSGRNRAERLIFVIAKTQGPMTS